MSHNIVPAGFSSKTHQWHTCAFIYGIILICKHTPIHIRLICNDMYIDRHPYHACCWYWFCWHEYLTTNDQWIWVPRICIQHCGNHKSQFLMVHNWHWSTLRRVDCMVYLLCRSNIRSIKPTLCVHLHASVCFLFFFLSYTKSYLSGKTEYRKHETSRNVVVRFYW